MNLQGRVALITGGAGHIGLAIGEALAELGASIAVLDMADCETAAQRLHETYRVETLPEQVDLNDEAAVRAVRGQGLPFLYALSDSPPPHHNFISLPPIRSERPVYDARHGDSAEARRG